MLSFHVITLFPAMVEGALSEGVIARARERGLIQIQCRNPRDFATDRHRTCDDAPYGGGGGMIMKPEPLGRCLDAVLSEVADAGLPKPRVVFMCPQGRTLTQPWARELAGVAQEPVEERPRGLVLVCGRYEAIDERLYDLYCEDRLSIGDYVLSGGEPAAIVLVDVLTRLRPGVLGCSTGADHDSFSPGNKGLLDAPHYTRPEVFRGRRVPDVLLSGDHAAIGRWRAQQSLDRTRSWRPDLLPIKSNPSADGK